MTTSTEAEQPTLITLTILKTASAPKHSKRSAGKNIHYNLWTDDQRRDVLWQISGNDGGGQHSLELVPMAKVQSTVAALTGHEPFRTRLLRSVFSGRSTNNAGFLVCAMYAEGLLAAASTAHHHVVQSDWRAWQQACLDLPGEQREVSLALATEALPVDTSEQPSKGQRVGKRKQQAPVESEHADAA